MGSYDLDIIESGFEKRSEISPDNHPPELKQAIDDVLMGLDSGDIRIAEKTTSGWEVNQVFKKAVLLSFKILDNRIIPAGYTNFYDKVAMKFPNDSDVAAYQKAGVRIVPPAHARYGAYIGRNTVLMPSYVNIGAYVDEGCMIDTWATIGSCAQVGKNCHISGGAGLGGVLEPIQANPTIIEDNCFIGARSEIVEGVIVEENSVVSMGVFLGQSTKIYNRETGEISYGRIPKGSVVIPGSLPAKDGSHSTYCAIIVKQVDEKTRAKISINELLRMS